MPKHSPAPFLSQGFRVFYGTDAGGIERTIADCNFSRIRDTGMRLTAAEFTECAANVALFAASHDLLRELKKVLACIEATGACLGDMEGMRDAIRKAETV